MQQQASGRLLYQVHHHVTDHAHARVYGVHEVHIPHVISPVEAAPGDRGRGGGEGGKLSIRRRAEGLWIIKVAPAEPIRRLRKPQDPSRPERMHASHHSTEARHGRRGMVYGDTTLKKRRALTKTLPTCATP